MLRRYDSEEAKTKATSYNLVADEEGIHTTWKRAVSKDRAAAAKADTARGEGKGRGGGGNAAPSNSGSKSAADDRVRRCRLNAEHIRLTPR